MRIKANSDGFNINYFDFSLANPVLGFNEKHLNEVKMYPNPVSSDFKLEFINDSHGAVKIGLYNMNGILVEELYHENTAKGSHALKFSLDKNLQSGMYILEIKNHDGRNFKKLFKN